MAGPPGAAAGRVRRCGPGGRVVPGPRCLPAEPPAPARRARPARLAALRGALLWGGQLALLPPATSAPRTRPRSRGTAAAGLADAAAGLLAKSGPGHMPPAATTGPMPPIAAACPPRSDPRAAGGGRRRWWRPTPRTPSAAARALPRPARGGGAASPGGGQRRARIRLLGPLSPAATGLRLRGSFRRGGLQTRLLHQAGEQIKGRRCFRPALRRGWWQVSPRMRQSGGLGLAPGDGRLMCRRCKARR